MTTTHIISYRSKVNFRIEAIPERKVIVFDSIQQNADGDLPDLVFADLTLASARQLSDALNRAIQVLEDSQ